MIFRIHFMIHSIFLIWREVPLGVFTKGRYLHDLFIIQKCRTLFRYIIEVGENYTFLPDKIELYCPLDFSPNHFLLNLLDFLQQKSIPSFFQLIIFQKTFRHFSIKWIFPMNSTTTIHIITVIRSMKMTPLQ